MNMKKKLVAGGLVACMGATLIAAPPNYFTDSKKMRPITFYCG